MTTPQGSSPTAISRTFSLVPVSITDTELERPLATRKDLAASSLSLSGWQKRNYARVAHCCRSDASR
jgi:hypothetical protein